MHIYAAWDLESREIKRDSDEFLEPFVVKFPTLVQWVKTGKIRDAKSVVAILAIKTFGLNPYK